MLQRVGNGEDPVRPDEPETHLSLDGGGVIRGTVRLENGRPGYETSLELSGGWGARTAECAPDGSFVVASLPRGVYRVTANTFGHRTPEVIVETGGDPADLVFRRQIDAR